VRLHSPYGLLPTHPVPPSALRANHYETAQQNRNHSVSLIDAAVWCRFLTAVHTLFLPNSSTPKNDASSMKAVKVS